MTLTFSSTLLMIRRKKYSTGHKGSTANRNVLPRRRPGRPPKKTSAQKKKQQREQQTRAMITAASAIKKSQGKQGADGSNGPAYGELTAQSIVKIYRKGEEVNALTSRTTSP